MAQTIKIKRGGYGAIASLTGTNAGELALVTGSAGSISNFPTPFSVLLANDGANWRVPLGGIVTGSGVPGTPNNARFNGILYYDTTGNQFYRLSAGGNQQLDVAATVQFALTAGNGLFANGVPGGTFNGSSAVTFSINSASININHLGSTPLTVAKGGTGATSLTTNGVLLGGGTVTATAAGTSGQILIGQSGAPTFHAVGGMVSLSNTGVVSFSAAGKTAISGAFAAASNSIASDINALQTQAAGFVDTAGTPLDNQIAIFTDNNTIEGDANVTYNGTVFTLGSGKNLSVGGTGTFGGDVAVNGDDLTTTQTTFNLVNATATTVNFAGAATTLNIGASTGTATIRNATINLGESSGDQVNILGNLNVAGTTTTVNSTTVNIGDRIIELNYSNAAGDAGILVHDTNGSQTGSLLWDTAGNYWKTGLATNGTGGGTLFRIPEFTSTTNITDNTLIVADGSGRLEGSGKFTEDATNGIVSAPKLTNLAGANIDGAGVLIIEPTSNEVASVTTESSVELAHIFGTKTDGTLVFSNVIDGGSF
jgi:hypothetical protein